MKLVSFDVGLRNLAFCVLEGSTRRDVTIVHWDLIDVMAESAGHDGAKCFKCKKPANWMKHDGSAYCCKLHRPKGAGKPPTKTSLNKKTLDELKIEGTQHSLTGTTKKELVEKLYNFYCANVWKRCVKSAKQISVVDLAEPIAKCLESRRDLWEGADLICFEQQPDKRMLCVQAMLHMWYVCQGYKCKGVSAVHKLTNMVTVQDSTKTYKGRKSTGIIHAKELVPTQELKEYMMKHPKRDDLADSFLQGLWVLENNK